MSGIFLFLFIGFQEANAQGCVTAVPITGTITVGAAEVPTGWTMISSPDGSNRYKWQDRFFHYVNGVATTVAAPPDGSTTFPSAWEGDESATAPFTVTTDGSELTVYIGGFAKSGLTGKAPTSFTVDAQDVHITLNGTRIDGVGTIAEDGGWHTLDLSQWNSGVYIVEVISDRGSEHIKDMKKN